MLACVYLFYTIAQLGHLAGETYQSVDLSKIVKNIKLTVECDIVIIHDGIVMKPVYSKFDSAREISTYVKATLDRRTTPLCH